MSRRSSDSASILLESASKHTTVGLAAHSAAPRKHSFVTTIGNPAVLKTRVVYRSGQAGSIGTNAAPAFKTANKVTMSSGDDSRQIPINIFGVPPQFTR